MARAKNNNLKPANQEMEYTHDQVIELKKCMQDPIYFIESYVKIQHPLKGIVNFQLYDYQKKMIKMYVENRDNIVLSSRQTGKSITSSAFLLWYSIFNFDRTVLIASNKNSSAMEMILRIRFAYENLPMWIKPGIKDDGWNKHEIGFDNNSRIISTATSVDSGRSMSISLLYLDEFAFVKPIIQDEFWTSITPTLATGGSCIMTSTPNGDSNIFANIWRGALAGTNGFKPIHVKWWEAPGRDNAFKQAEIGKIGTMRWRQEYECEFLSSDTLLIDSIILNNLTRELDDVKPIKDVNDVKIYEEISDKTYLVGVDPSTGNGEDYCVIEIYDFPDMVQVGEYRSNTMSTNESYGVLKNILTYLVSKGATVYFSIENNGVGQGMIALYNNDENDFPDANFVSDGGKGKFGINTTSRGKLRCCITLKELLERGDLKIKSGTILSELKSYVRHRGSYAAQRGSTDDCISATLIVLRVLEEMATYEDEAYDKLYVNDYDDWSEGDWDGENETSDEDYDPDNDDDMMPIVF